MIEDVRLKTQFDEKYGVGNGEVIVYDMTGYGVGHVAKTSVWILKTLMKYLQVKRLLDSNLVTFQQKKIFTISGSIMLTFEANSCHQLFILYWKNSIFN